MNLFSVPTQDQSLFYLGQIFGPVGNVLGSTTGGISGGTVLGAMFQTFNSVVLVVGALIIVYITVIGVIKTAHEGEFLGKHWNNVWTPLRMVIGIAALVPSTSGYSTIQIIMMWIVVQGIGAADAIWTTVLKYQQLAGSPFGPVSIPTVNTGNTMQNLFQALACQESAHGTDQLTTQNNTNGAYFCAIPDNASTPFCRATGSSSDLWNIVDGNFVRGTDVNSPNITYYMGPPGDTSHIGGACGKLTYCNPKNACNGVVTSSSMTDRIACATCTAGQEALQSVVTVFSQIGSALQQADAEYRTFLKEAGTPPAWVRAFCDAQGYTGDSCCPSFALLIPGITLPNQTCKLPILTYGSGTDSNAAKASVQSIYWPFKIQPSMVGDINFISASTNNYVGSISAASTGIIQQMANENALTDETLRKAGSVGWLYAGAYYYYLAKGTANNISASMPTFFVAVTDPSVLVPPGILASFRNNFRAAGWLVSSAAGPGDEFSATLPPELSDLSKISDGLNSANSSMMDTFMHDIGGGKYSGQPQLVTNPLSNLQNFGKNLLIVAQLIFALVLTVIAGLTLLGYFDVYVLGTGVNNPVGGTLTTLAVLFSPLLALFLGALFSFGALLSVYTPLIPYIVFTMGAVSWFILVIEAMVAAPIIALGILSPGEGHEILGKAHHALLISFSIFLRPALMIFGMMAAMLLAAVVVTMINTAFQGVMGSITKGFGQGLVEMLLFMGAYVGLILAALNKCFALIHIIPDQTLRWIGYQGAGAEGAAEAGLMGAKGGVAAAATSTGGYATGMQQKMEKSASKTSAAAQARLKEAGQEGAGLKMRAASLMKKPPKK